MVEGSEATWKKYGWCASWIRQVSRHEDAIFSKEAGHRGCAGLQGLCHSCLIPHFILFSSLFCRDSFQPPPPMWLFLGK